MEVDWLKWIDGTISYKPIMAQADSNNNIYISGITNQPYVIISGNTYNIPNSNAGFILKMTPEGVVEWFNPFITYNNQSNIISLLNVNNDEYIYASCRISGSATINGITYNAIQEGLVIVKFDINGNLIKVVFIDSILYEEFRDIKMGKDNNIYFHGNTHNSSLVINGITYNTGTLNLSKPFIVKFNLDLNVLLFSIIKGNSDVFTGKLAVDSLNNYYITGQLISTIITVSGDPIDIIYNRSSGVGYYITGFNANGSNKWMKFIRSTTSSGVIVKNTCADSKNNIYILYNTALSTAWIDIDNKRYSLNSNNISAFLLKINSNGEILNVKLFSNTHSIDAINCDSNDNIYISGSSSGTNNIIINDVMYYSTEKTTNDIFILKIYGGSENIEIIKWISGNTIDIPYYIKNDADNNIILAGLSYSHYIKTDGTIYNKVLISSNTNNSAGIIIKLKEKIINIEDKQYNVVHNNNIIFASGELIKNPIYTRKTNYPIIQDDLE